MGENERLIKSGQLWVSFQHKNICAVVEDVKYVLHYSHVHLINKAASFHKSPNRNKASHCQQHAELSGKLLWTYGNASYFKKRNIKRDLQKVKSKASALESKVITLKMAACLSEQLRLLPHH